MTLRRTTNRLNLMLVSKNDGRGAESIRIVQRPYLPHTSLARLGCHQGQLLEYHQLGTDTKMHERNISIVHEEFLKGLA